MEKNPVSSTDSAWPALSGNIIQTAEAVQVAANSPFPAEVPRFLFQAQ